jgi:hypothetical protein
VTLNLINKKKHNDNTYENVVLMFFVCDLSFSSYK